VDVWLTDAAIADLLSIGDRIAADSPARATEFIELLRERCLQLADFPLAFPLVPRFAALGVRRRPVGDYLVFYRIQQDRVEVLHVLHGARDYELLLFPTAPSAQ
jgi:plasmid stabilization system protein ParE